MKSSSVSSIRDTARASHLVNIPGTRVSLSNSQLHTSTGSSTLDFFLGGGLAVGTVCVIEEDRYNTYASLLMKYFLAEGATRGHFLFLAGGDDKDPKDFLKELPAGKTVELNVKDKPTLGKLHDPAENERNIRTQYIEPLPASISDSCNSKSEDTLKIAWRYKHQSVEESIKADSLNMSFDLTKSMPYKEIEDIVISTWVPADSSDELCTDFLTLSYFDLLNKIRESIEAKELKTSSKNINTILRIGINSISSPLWRTGNNTMDDLQLLRFLFALKALLRTSFAAAVITIPSCLSSNRTLISRVRQMCDTVISLESFVGSDKKSNPLFKDFDGLLHIKKLPILNDFTYPSMPEDLAFKLKKRTLLIERLHLPPDLSDPMPEQQSQFGCSGLGRKLDF